MNRPNLETRFQNFLNQLAGAENIDATFSSSDLSSGKRADYLLNSRQVVIEIKSLEIDPEWKAHKRLHSLQSRPDYPLFYWESELQEILSHLEDGDKIRVEIADAVTRRVQKLIAAADDQIEATSKSLKLSDACGIVVILNEDIGILEPHIIAAAGSKVLLKKKGDDFRYKNVHYLWVISEAHSIRFDSKTECLPMVVLDGPLAEKFCSQGIYLNGLLEEWSAFEGMPLSGIIRQDDLQGLSFDRRVPKQDVNRSELSRHEIWRLAYREKPYLRKLSETEFLQHGADILKMLAPSFIKGGKKQPDATIARLFQLFTDVLEEAEHRRLDMRKIQRYLPNFREIIDSQNNS